MTRQGMYITGGLFWLIVPLALGSSAGLATIALSDNPAFPTYPRALSASEIGPGLAVPYALTALLGKIGAAMALIVVSVLFPAPSFRLLRRKANKQVFMSVTSSSSAEFIACSVSV
jgi:hypothetical protein